MVRMETSAAARWQDWASFGLGLWLAVSPWVLGYAHVDAATGNAAFVGLAIALSSHFEVSFDERSAEWFTMAAALWLVLSPFLLGFTAATVATLNAVGVGTLVAALATSALSLDKQLARWWEKGSEQITGNSRNRAAR
jgi:hypothetical protein